MKKAVLVTGGTSGLGLELCLKLDSLGYAVITVSRSADKLEALKDLDIRYYQGDISDEDFVNGFVHEASKDFEIVGVINSASEGYFAMPTEIHAEHVEKCLKGVKGMMYVSAALLREKNEQNLRIVNILSTAAQKGKKMEAAYCMAKFAQRGYTEALKDAYKDSNVKVAGVYLGGMDTNLWTSSRDYISEEKQATFMNPAEIADKIVSAYFVDDLDEDLEITRK